MGSWVRLLSVKGVPDPAFKLCGRSRIPGSKVLVPLLHHAFRFNSFSIWQPLIGIACTGGISKTNSNCSFNRIHCSCYMVTCFSHTSHKSAMAGSYFCYLFKYYPRLVEWILYWLRFSTFSSDDNILLFLKDYGIYCKGSSHLAILIYSKCMIYYSYSH